MDTFLIILAGLLLIIGLLGSILPLLPGIPLSYAGILLLHFTDRVQFSTNFLVFWAVIVFVVQLLDYILPLIATRKFGSSRKALIGSTLGLFAGFFIGPWGIIIGPLLGTMVAEYIISGNRKQALRATFGSLIGILTGTISKLIVAGFLIYYYFEALI